MIPYGHSIVGSLFFDQANQFGCDKYETSFTENQEPPIYIVRRGQCSFVKKVWEIEHAGGKLAIIVDEVDNEEMD